MKRDRSRQILTIFSLFMLLVLPTAIVGYGNFSKIVNQAFAKPFQKQESTYIVQTESSTNITKGDEFSVKLTAVAPKALPLQHFAAFVEFDSAKVDIKAVRVQNNPQLAVTKFQNGFLVFPASMSTPIDYDALLPATCSRENTCDFSKFSATSVVLSINGILLSDLTSQQRPIKISLLGASETSTLAIWNEKLILPSLNLGSYVKNETPRFTSEPAKYTRESEQFIYDVSITDADNDPVILSLTCPEASYCAAEQKAPAGVTIENNELRWESPIPSEQPYEITVYANDGKSVSTQTFALHVLKQNATYFTCSFTPAVSVRILDYRVSTPMVIVAESSAELTSAVVTLTKNDTVEQTFSYAFKGGTRSVILDQSSKPSLAYQFKEGLYNGTATFTSQDGQTFTCELENPTVSLFYLLKQSVRETVATIVRTVQAATGVEVGTNSAPKFTTDPMVPASSGGSDPSVSFVYGTPYTFTLKAQDPDGDPMQHTIVTKPGWATASISLSASGTIPSTYSIQFTGTPTAKDAGSNLFSVSVNDGYDHYITRTWVINVDYPNNDIPRVLVKGPLTSISRYQGSPFLLEWDVEDRHQVVSFGVYYTKQLGSSTKTTYNKNVSYRTRSMTINTSSMSPGDYYFIITATDGFSPPATGSGYTAMVRILPPKPKPTATPKPTVTPTATATTTVTPTLTATPEPTLAVDEVSIQITSPKNQDSIKPSEFQAVISLQASSKGTVSVSATKIQLDAQTITDKFTFSGEQGKSLTASYKPSTLLEPGVHELIVYTKDSVQKEKEVKISFIITADEGTDPNTVSIFGVNMSKSAYTIFIAALILIAILFLLPIILYLAYRNSDKDKDTIARRPVSPIQPVAPPTLRTPTTPFVTPAQQPSPIVTPSTSTAPVFKPITTPPPAQPITQPVFVEEKGPRAGIADIPSISPDEAMASFIEQAPLQSQHKTAFENTNRSSNSPATLPSTSKPIAQFQAMPQSHRLAPDKTMTETRTPVQQHAVKMPTSKPYAPPTSPINHTIPAASSIPKPAPVTPLQNLPPQSPSIPKL